MPFLVYICISLFVGGRWWEQGQVILATALCTTAHSATRGEVENYKARNRILRQRLTSEGCSVRDTDRSKRHTNFLLSDNDIQLEIEKELYEQLFDQLVKCRQDRRISSAGSTPIMTSPSTYETSGNTPDYSKLSYTSFIKITTDFPKAATTTPMPVPAECLSAKNLTESWRNINSGPALPQKGHYKCDQQDMVAAGRPWFRFTGLAGTRISSKCVPHNSCGTGVPLWTDKPMPREIGVVFPLTVYGSLVWDCKKYTIKASVLRCSAQSNDFVYRHDDSDRCYFGYCGMYAWCRFLNIFWLYKHAFLSEIHVC